MVAAEVMVAEATAGAEEASEEAGEVASVAAGVAAADSAEAVVACRAVVSAAAVRPAAEASAVAECPVAAEAFAVVQGHRLVAVEASGAAQRPVAGCLAVGAGECLPSAAGLAVVAHPVEFQAVAVILAVQAARPEDAISAGAAALIRAQAPVAVAILAAGGLAEAFPAAAETSAVREVATRFRAGARGTCSVAVRAFWDVTMPAVAWAQHEVTEGIVA
ncbi:MAG: hypothetical protein ACT4QC_00130 [Planctomycetaceae bacterium]